MAKVIIPSTQLVNTTPQVIAEYINKASSDKKQELVNALAGNERFAALIKKEQAIKINNYRAVIETFAPILYIIDDKKLDKELKYLQTSTNKLIKALKQRDAIQKENEEKSTFERKDIVLPEVKMTQYEKEIYTSFKDRPNKQIADILSIIKEGIYKGVADFISISKPKEINYFALGKIYSTAGQFLSLIHI